MFSRSSLSRMKASLSSLDTQTITKVAVVRLAMSTSDKTTRYDIATDILTYAQISYCQEQ